MRNGVRKIANAVNKGLHTRAVAVIDAAATTYSRTLAAANTWTTSTTTVASSLTSVLGPAAVVLGLRARAIPAERGQGTAGLVIGVLVTVVATVALGLDL